MRLPAVAAGGRAGGLVVGLALAAALAGCLRSRPAERLTGTCAGACSHYLACKRSDDPALYRACVAECGQVFADPESLRAFESLYCADAIDYVEGPDGREPGQPPASPPVDGAVVEGRE